jgi:hypothetical protein
MDDDSLKLDDYTLKPLPPPAHHLVDSTEILYQDYAIVITGDIFRWMVNHAPLETLQRVGSKHAMSSCSYSLTADACESAGVRKNVT